MMPPRHRPALPRAVAPAVLLALTPLAGCGHSAKTTFLVLDPVPAGAVAAYAGPPLRVPALRLPVAVDRPELTRPGPAGTIEVEEFARWAGPVGLLARNALIGDLVQRLPAGTVLPPDAPAARVEVRVDVAVLDIRVEGGQAVATVAYALVPTATAGGKPAPSATPTVEQITAVAPDDSPAGRAQGWSALIGTLADHIAARVARPIA